MSTSTDEQTAQALVERYGSLYDLATLARYCQVRRARLRRALERAGVPIIEVGRKQLVPQELAEQALGLDVAQVLLEIHRNEQWMHHREFRDDGRRKTAGEYADEMSDIARRALQAPPAPQER